MNPSFLTGTGEMAERMRAFDWSGSSLGAPDGWPVTLRATVRLLLCSRRPMFIFWGDEHVCLYNDATSASLGPEKHPGILGAPGRKAWPEIWDVIGPEIEFVMRGDGGTWHEDLLVPIVRHGALQDVYWTFSFDPIADESATSGVGGVLVVCNETTQQVSAARHLTTERERLARLFEQAPGFMAMLSGPEHRFELANPAYLSLIGNRDVLGRSVAEALPEAEDQGYLDLLDGVFRSGKPYAASGVAYRRPRENGTFDERRIDFVYQPITDDANEVIGIFVEGVDVTQRVRADAALRRSEEGLKEREEQLRLATEAADIGLWDVDLVAGTLFWPPRVKAMFGISADVPVSMADYYAGLHPDDVAHTVASFEAALDPAKRSIYDVEYRTIGKEDRRIRWVAAKGRGVFDDDGRCVRVIGTAIDITSRKADEALLRELNETLEQRVAEALADKKVFADIVEGTDAFVQVADMNYRFVAINKASADEFERLFGIRPKVGDSMLQLLQHLPEQRDAVAAVWGRALGGEQFTATGQFSDLGGSLRHYEMKFNILRDRNGQQVGAYQFVYDVTDRVRADARLAQAESALQQAQKMEAVGQLTGGIAHDFNNLLQAIQGSLHLIQRLPSDGRIPKWVESALRSVRRATTLTSQLLTFARQQQLERRPLQVGKLVTSMTDMLQRSIGPLVLLQVSAPDIEASVVADATQLEMAILNLAINARDAMPKGGLLTIATGLRTIVEDHSLKPGEYVEIVVRDTGQGMPAEVVSRAFDPFFTTKEAGKGTGLGLSQAYGTARQAGGSAYIESEVGRGTAVILLLPRADAIDGATSTTPALVGDKQAAQCPLKVLVVDGDVEVRTVLVTSLQALGHSVTAAEDGLAGLGMLDGARPDLMVLDFAMPGINGLETAIRARARHPSLPIVFTSGYADLAAIKVTVDSPWTVLRKPFDVEEFEDAFRSVLDEARNLESHPRTSVRPGTGA